MDLRFLVLCAASPGKDNGTEPISVMFNTVREHIWRNLGSSMLNLSRSFISFGLRLWTSI